MSLAGKHTLILSRLLWSFCTQTVCTASKCPSMHLTLQAWECWNNVPGSAAPGHTSQLGAEESGISKIANLWAINKIRVQLKICGIQFQPSPVWKAPLIGKRLRVAHSKPLFPCCKEYRILISVLFIKRIGKPESLCFSILFQECGF